MAYGPSLWERLEPAWTTLTDATGETSPFLSRIWLKAWIDVFGPSLRPEGLVWRDERGSAVGCVLWSRARVRLGPFRVLRAYANATGEGALASEHNDLLVLPACRHLVTEEFLNRVRTLGADELSLVGFKAPGGTQLAARWVAEETPALKMSEDPYVDLDELRRKSQSYLTALSGNTRSQIKRSLKQYREAYGEPRVEVAPDVAAQSWLSELVELHEARWRSRGMPGAFSTEEVRRFHRGVIESAWQNPEDLTVDLVRVRFGEETVGLLYNLKRAHAVSFYQSGFRYHADNRLKPGLVVHALAIQHYLEVGAREYDFLAGEPPAQYKQSLCTAARQLVWAELPAPTVRMRAIEAIRLGFRNLKRLGGRRTPDAAEAQAVNGASSGHSPSGT